MESRFRDFSLKIPLFRGTKVLVKEGERVSQEQVLLRVTHQPVVEVDLASALAVKPTQVASCLKIGLGAGVKKGQILAQKGRFWRKKRVFAPITGKIEALLEEEGILKIKTERRAAEIRSPLDAKVISLEKNFLVLQFPALVLPARQAFGRSGWGNLGDFSGHFFDLKKIQARIILVENLTEAILNKLEALGATGAVCLELEEGIEKGVEESGVLVLSTGNFKKAKENGGQRAKVDVGDKRLIIAK